MPGSTKFVRQHFYENVEHKATNRQLCAVPHQAPQRERVSLVVRGSVLLQSTGDALKTDSSWKRKIKGNNLESIPRLLWLLEPKIVFAHAKASCRGQYAESLYCQGMFFEGYHRGGGRAHGVYEGTYWDLLANIGELTEALTQMAVGPTVLEEPVLQLPPSSTLPSWDNFKPVLQPLPPLPQSMEVAVRLPPFKLPKVAPVEYEAPPLLPLPDLLDEEEEVVPALVLPDGLKPRGLGMQPEEIAFDPPLPPSYPLQPAPPPYDKPVYGADWTGLKPFQEAEPVMTPDAVLPVLLWQHPPATLPMPPHGDLSRPSASSSASLARMIGGLALAGTTAAITVHPASPRAHPAAACGRPRNVASGVQSGPSAAGAKGQEPLPLQEADGENGAGLSSEGQDLISASAGAADDGQTVTASQSGYGGTGRNLNESDEPARQDPGQSSGRGLGGFGVGVGPSSGVGQSGGAENSRATVGDLSAGPSQGPAPEFVQPYQEPLPPREALAFHPLPVFDHPAFQAPAYAPPCAPRPIGFLAGYAPLLLLDISGTMHPSKGGRFLDMKACALELLKPTGELAAVASGFDVIAFSSAPTSWAACYEGHLTLLEGASRPLVGRQNGRRAYRPNSANTGCMRLQKGQSAKLVPAEPGLLAEASRWVDSWQEPTGHTNYDAALQMAERYLEADCEYIFSDGLSDYAVVLLEKLRKRVMQGERVPVIHTVGFFAEEQRGGPGERFLRQLSALTGGTFQEYRPEVWTVWSGGEWLEYDLARETAAGKAERLWSEAALQAQRRNNARLSLEESFLDLMSRLPKLHALRVAAEAVAHEQEAAVLRAAHEAECAIVRKLNADIQRRNDEEYYRMTEPMRTRNEVLMAAAQQQHDAAIQQWQKEYSLAVMEWESLQEVSTPALQQQHNSSKAKLPRLATLQPEDSAEQLSNSAMPGRQGTSARQLPAQDIQQAPDAFAATNRSDAEFKFAQPAQHRDSHAAGAAADHLRPLDQQFQNVPGSGTALQPSDAMLEQNRASGLEDAQTGADTSSEGSGGFAPVNAVVAEQHQEALAEVQYRNALNKQRHLDEVKAERAAWEEHEANIKRWKATKADLEAAYANELSEAKGSHQQHVARIRRQWEKEQKVLQAEYNRRVAIERAQHEVVCEPVRQRNAERHEAAARRREQQRHIQKANDDLVAAAEQLHQQRLFEAQAALSGQLVVARQQHSDVCMQLQKEHAALQQAALQEHASQKAVVARWNDQATLEARGRFSMEISRLQKAHARVCEGVQAQHNMVCDQVRKHNDAIWPQVSIAQAAQGELHRVERFIEHIRACAEKMEIGVNYVPETPNLDRVVEMSALTDALQKAFPDLTPDQYPWPNTQDRGAGGVSKGVVRGAWPAPPKTHTSASSAQQALDRIRQAALPSRPVSASRVRHDSSEQQVASVPQASDSSWCSQIPTYTTTTHSGASYRPLTTSSRPSTAHLATPRAAHHGSHPRPASARDHTGRLATGHASAHSPGSSVAAAAAAAVLRMDGGHLHVTQLVQSKGQQQSGFRSVSPISGGSTGATPSPAQTPCSVLSRPSTAGQRRGYQPARKAFDAAEISNCLQRHKLASMHSLR
ncbi:hypothetical protein WJX82_004313 [Trebouxia sp. C0006]